MINTFEIQTIPNQDFAAPNGTIGSIPRPVKDQTSYLCHWVETILNHPSRKVGMMMLNWIAGKLFRLHFFQGIFCCEVVRMQIISDGFWLDAEQGLVMFYCFLEILVSLPVFHLTYVVAEKSISIPCQAEGVFHLRSNCKHLR